MLESLSIENYAVVKKATLDLHRGMSAITGETGAGKSISVDALELVMGGRADSKSVRNGANATTICATFDLSDSPRALGLLKEYELLSEDNELCIIRRTITRDGRSKAFVNDIHVNTNILRELSARLLNIHGQHDGQLLLKSEHQIEYLDAFAELGDLLSEVESLYYTYSNGRDEVNRLGELQKDMVSEYKLTMYQTAELSRLAPKENEFAELSNEYDRLSNVHTLLQNSMNIHGQLTDDENGILTSLNTLVNSMSGLVKMDRSLSPLLQNIENARIQLEDAAGEISQYSSTLEADPERLSFINERMTLYTDMAHKYSVTPDELYKVLEELHDKSTRFTSIKDEIQARTAEVVAAKKAFMEKAHELSDRRREMSVEFCRKITEMLHELSMPNAMFEVEFSETQPHPNGIDSVCFKFNANAGMTPDLISKTASGGEISRIALAILVLTANKISAPTLIFDEIDTGISGFTAATTGKLLRRLAKTSQVITVTHLPQVAASAHNQYEVLKKDIDNETFTSITELDDEGRVQEIARLLGGSAISDSALANARELLSTQSAEQ
ncbi:DNA repair protein RecN (Recombination protein N) [Ruminobacter amylophilus]|uniref:DNA repair protein RecN n=1 Tax=Ruminobacter amylophilus TaxID=867 RepID=A0A662ZIS7_9GAMM|nr:DNA repair protein RecN [Ruminobacter amylophilus]SFP15851.1 DNA repair protein RecN (Recombination protein N) [Ruminobacter amylophilus]